MAKIASMIFTTGLLLASLTYAYSKTYEIFLPAPTQAGSVLLVPGQYRVMVEGNEAVFLDVRTARSFRTAVKVDQSSVTYEVTRIITSKDAGCERINAIEFEGSAAKIEF